MMSFTVTIGGHTDDANAEHDLFNALQAVVSNAEFGVTNASGVFEFAGAVDLLPTAPPPPPAPSLDELLGTVAGDVQALDDSDAKTKLLADFNALADAVHASESESSAPASSSPSSDAPATSDDAPAEQAVDHTGTPVAL